MNERPCLACGEPKPAAAFSGKNRTCKECRAAARKSAQARTLYRDASLREGRGFTPDKQADYLALLAQRVQPAKAAEMVGVAMRTIRDYRGKDPAFVEAETQARADSVAPVVDKLYELAMEGHMTAILFVLQNADPDNWKDMRRVEKKVTHGGSVQLEAGQSLQNIAKYQAILAERAALRGALAAAPSDRVVDAVVLDDEEPGTP